MEDCVIGRFGVCMIVGPCLVARTVCVSDRIAAMMRGQPQGVDTQPALSSRKKGVQFRGLKVQT